MAGDMHGRMARVFRRRQLRAAPFPFVSRPDQHVWLVWTSAATTTAVGCSPSCLDLILRANVQGWVLGLQTAPGDHMPSSVCTAISLGGEWANSFRRGLRPASSNWFPTSNFLLFPVHPVYYISILYLHPDLHVSYHKQSLPRCPLPPE